MNHKRFHLLEKIQVQLAAAAALLVVYFLIWPALRPADPQSPLTCLPERAYADGLLFVGVVWLLAAACAVVTINARPESALVAALIGSAGASARSARISALLWLWGGNFPGLYGVLVLEVLLMGVVIFGAGLIVDVVRRVIAHLRPGWLWGSPLSRLMEGQQEVSAGAGGSGGRGFERPPQTELVLYLLRACFVRDRGPEPSRKTDKNNAARLSVCCLGLSLVVAVVMLVLLMRSSERGQILFALLAAFIVASAVAHQAFPTPYSIVVWGMPILVAMGLYGLAAVSTSQPASWIDVPKYAKALPVDWLTAGCGGALIGYWISARIHELRHVERLEGVRQR